MSVSIEKLVQDADKLGESPIWNARTEKLYWVDSIAPKVRCHDTATGTVTEWSMPGTVGSIGMRCDDDLLIAALADGFYELNLNTGTTRHLASPQEPDPKARFNDGRMDRSGRFLSGTLVPHGHDRLGNLYRLNHDLTVEKLDSGFHISNTLCFSPLGDVLYFADTLNRSIWAYDYDNDSGQVSNRRVLIETGNMKSGTDGACVDSDGCLWVAMVEVGRIARITPAGRLDRLIELPLLNIQAAQRSAAETLMCSMSHRSGTAAAAGLLAKNPESGKILTIPSSGCDRGS